MNFSVKFTIGVSPKECFLVILLIEKIQNHARAEQERQKTFRESTTAVF
jgi:hypothetical protein